MTSDEYSDEVAVNLEYGRLEAQLASIEASLEHERGEVLLELERLEALATPVHCIEPASRAPVSLCPDNVHGSGQCADFDEALLKSRQETPIAEKLGSLLASQPDPKSIPPLRQGQRATSPSFARTSWASNVVPRASAAACSRFHTRLSAWRPPPICIPPDQDDSSCRQDQQGRMLHEAKVFLERGYNEGDSKDLPLPPCDEFLALEQAIREMAAARANLSRELVDARLELDNLASDVSALLPERLPCHASNSQAALILDEYEARVKLSDSAHTMSHASNSQAALIFDPHPASIPRDDRWGMQHGSGCGGGVVTLWGRGGHRH